MMDSTMNKEKEQPRSRFAEVTKRSQEERAKKPQQSREEVLRMPPPRVVEEQPKGE